jgi:uncharacterized integral membrane protein (TIGR00697 family)
MRQKSLNGLSTGMLSVCHIFLITLSNVLVQYPFTLWGFHTTFGAFIYPAIFILTDLTVRLSTANRARKIVFFSMLPGLLISYVVASYIETSNSQTINSIFVIHAMPLRIAIACFIAYVVGQLLDIFVFQHFRNKPSWWLAPSLSTTMGNLIDTMVFFAIAFYHCSNQFLSQHWTEIATVDVIFKVAISLIAFIPVYGIIVNIFDINAKNKLAVVN